MHSLQQQPNTTTTQLPPPSPPPLALGGDSSAVAADLAGGVLDIATSRLAFVAITSSGKAVTW